MSMMSVEKFDQHQPASVLLFLMVAFLCLLFPAAVTSAGSITLIADSPQTITHAWVIQWSQDANGVYAHTTLGQQDANTGRIVFNDLKPGRYNLKFQTESGVIEGWDTHVPDSDYEIEQPLAKASIATLTQKLQSSGATGFDDQVAILDIQGNIQNAAILTRQLRSRKFVGGKYKRGEWVFRVTRWQWESPDEITWAPWQEQPSFAFIRERLTQETFNALHITYARHLGGIVLPFPTSNINLGTVLVPKQQQGVVAVNPDGSLITPIIIKPAATTQDSSDDQQPASSKGLNNAR